MAPPREPVSARRIARWCCASLIVAGLAGACRLDDRTLTGTKLTSSAGVEPGGECPNSGDTPCETCLYQQCCDELQACGPASPCALYLTCVTDCDTDVVCANACAEDSPAGYDGAVGLSVCARGRCNSCSGQTEPTSCNPTGAGACQNPMDCPALEAGALERVDVLACAACDQALLTVPCERCLSAQTGLSLGCSVCVAGVLECLVENCVVICQGDADPSACELCMRESGCSGQFERCGFAG